ncbi:hypothetical protein MED01_002424 [Micromonospora sp. MED01]|uniref:hypothetical protein n=1 Tax=Micromonospora alfalfae TaxID=2911212 RepID=UPI001EE8A2C5|nr:hypothetical protein [Micromonospora alfalfae]MCG5464259.1 hypothetical protein [Micromonospora alfalfae]
MAENEQHTDSAAVWGQRIALATAVALTAKGEFDLAVMAHFVWYVAWMFPVMIDVYVVTAFHKRRWLDVGISLCLMLFCQVAVHLVPVFITDGEETPWGLVMAVACIAPIVVVRVKALTGKTRDEIEAAAEATRKTEDLRKTRADLAEATRKNTDLAAKVRAEEAARKSAEERANAEEAARGKAEADALRARNDHEAFRLAVAEEQAEADAGFRAELDRLTSAHNTTTDRLRSTLDEVRASARDARTQAAEASELAARTAGQLDEARAAAERAIAEKLTAEQHTSAVQESRQAVVDELERVRAAHDRLARKVDDAARKNTPAAVPAPRRNTRKGVTANPAPVPAVEVEDVPAVEGVNPELVARVIAAWKTEPGAKNPRLAQIARTSDRTVRKVLNNVPRSVLTADGDDLEAETVDRPFANAR